MVPRQASWARCKAPALELVRLSCQQLQISHPVVTSTRLEDIPETHQNRVSTFMLCVSLHDAVEA